MAHQYTYLPRGVGQFGSVMLDANVTGHLDSIARRGSAFQDDSVRERIAELLEHLGDTEVLVMAGLGAAEADIRREVRDTDYANFHRRSAHALSLLNENRDVLRRWVGGESVEPVSVDLDSERQKQTEQFFGVAVENFLLPSNALLMQAYWAYLTDSFPMRALRSVERVAVETRCRGSKEMMLTILLIAGTHRGRELALNIMKLRSEVGYSQTLDALWNTSFDLTYTRLALTMPLWGRLPEPVVFVTADKHLSTFMNLIEPQGGARADNGAVMSLDATDLDGFVRDELADSIQDLMLSSAESAGANSMPVEQVATIRRYNSVKHIKRLQERFATRYAAEPRG